MAIRKKKKELRRLQEDFEKEASKYHNLSLSIFFISDSEVFDSLKFRQPNHVTMLWQYYGQVKTDNSLQQLYDDIKSGQTAFGLRGSKFSAFAVIEGEQVDLFKRMAYRAGSLFSDKEANDIKLKMRDDIVDNNAPGKPVFVSNNDTLALWINFVLFHLSVSHPRRFKLTKLDVDPFAASLTAIDHLVDSSDISRGKKTLSAIETRKFKVALSFPGEKRNYVERVAEFLSNLIGKDYLFYDLYYQAELARPNLDLLLQKIYHDNSDLVVIFLCEDYETKEWCGLEWRAIRDLIKKKQDDKIMFMRFDSTEIKGTYSIDGYIDLIKILPEDCATLIFDRVSWISSELNSA
jgi:hypothetical protein